MKRPKTSESKYWENDRFRHLLFIEDLEDYTTALEEQIAKNCVIHAVSGSSSPDDFWKQEYDEAVKEIGNLQDQLKDAESAIRDMESELRSRY